MLTSQEFIEELKELGYKVTVDSIKMNIQNIKDHNRKKSQLKLLKNLKQQKLK